MKASSVVLLGSLLSSTVFASRNRGTVFKRAYTPPPGSPGFYHGNSTAAVTFDNLSAFIGDKRVFIFSGEFHPWRLPSGIGAWRDVLQKMKAAGFNAVSVYLHWGLSEGKEGSLDFNYYRSHADFYKVAKEVGIHVIVRPGPYINAETLCGGLPPWLTNNPVESRTNATAYLDAWTPYIAATAKFAAPFQYPDGPIIAIQVENEFFPDADPVRSGYMVQIENVLRSNGITKVPLTHNDNGIHGEWSRGQGMVDLYTWDSYPNGFDCANPSSWAEVNPSDHQLKQHQRIDPDAVWVTSEFQGGAFDPWGGSSYDKCYQLLNDQFANVFYKNNVAGAVRWQSFYMTFGGTNWGNLAEPTVYTSYDYGAPIREDRTLTTKYGEIKLQAHFLHASADLYTTTIIFAGVGHTDNTNVYATYLKGQQGTGFYIFRQNTNSNTNAQTFTAPVNVTNTVITIPQFGSKITLAGRESKVLVTDYSFGKSTLKYATAEVMTWTTIDGIDIVVLYALASQDIEAVLSTSSSSEPIITGSSISAKTLNDTVLITGFPSGVSTVSFDSTLVIIADKKTATTFWNPRLAEPIVPYDMSSSVPSVLIMGPYLVRNATISGSTLELFGDINATTPISILAPKNVNKLTWNRKQIPLERQSSGVKSGVLSFELRKPRIPDLKAAIWSCIDTLPEVQSNFDDSSWTNASKTSTQRPYQPFAGKFVVYADEYGFHQGNTLYRGHFSGNATSIWLSVQGGFNFGYSVWINDIFLGSSSGTNQYTTSVDLTNTTWVFPSGSVKSGDNVVTVVFDQTGLEEDYDGNDSFKTPRGIRGYVLNGGTLDFWKLIGNFGGESYPDKVRGPFNEGGLFVERIGAHLPGFQVSGWQLGSMCNPAIGMSKAGITAYRTTFFLNLPGGSDIPIALKFVLDPSSNYRSVIYINGWQFGRFSSREGPQDTFPLPEGILDHNGKNTLLVTMWSLDPNGAKMGGIELINTALVQSSKEGGLVISPTFQQVRK